MAKILVTGGLGYIGSHTVVALQEAGFETLVVDNCSNSSEDVLERIKTITGQKPVFFKLDLKEPKSILRIIELNPDIDGIIHFAALKAVGESMDKPLEYYDNNLNTLINLLQGTLKTVGGARIVFSSSCTVYGQTNNLPISESEELQTPFSPYGKTKKIGEEIIRDSCTAYSNLKAISLRYFNPIGAHSSGLIGELPLGVPQNLVPFITQTAIGVRQELLVYGTDYPTKDGTCIRDYIHVMDLAEAHVVALRRLLEDPNSESYEVFNIGTGKGTSVLEVIKTFERVNSVSLPYKKVERRMGDVIAAFADTTKSKKVLKWKAKRTLEEALVSAWKWEQKIRA